MPVTGWVRRVIAFLRAYHGALGGLVTFLGCGARPR